jgi:hypothetical protein
MLTMSKHSYCETDCALIYLTLPDASSHLHSLFAMMYSLTP